jgi:hypothetical protein
VLTTLVTLSTRRGQTLLVYWLATPQIRQHRAWFWLYLIVASVFCTDLKNIIARVAQEKEALGERTWHTMPLTQTERAPHAET